ncbi:MAG TPA: RES family NAD+ phosphorylase [Terracidiphilus sp.]|nr:RES family NAD+ phosphorylase [Terracidiphilus sp.]
MNPPVRECSFPGAHRLIPSKHSTEGTVLAQLTDDEREVQELVELDGATNARLLGEEGLLPGIGVHELIYGVAYSQIVNASFTHAAPQGGRFNSNRRGAWYAGLERETSIAEVAFHKLEQLREIDWKFEEVSTCDDYLADFAAEFHDLRGASPGFRKYLKPSPIPECYRESQQLAAELLQCGSNGIVYPGVRRHGGTCIVCFRPVLVYHVRMAARLEFSLHVGRAFTTDQVREVKPSTRRRGAKKR